VISFNTPVVITFLVVCSGIAVDCLHNNFKKGVVSFALLSREYKRQLVLLQEQLGQVITVNDLKYCAVTVIIGDD
jgi:hypothetical protein